MRHRKPVPLHGTPSVQATFCGHVRETYSLAFAERQKRGRQAVENSRKPSTHSTKFRHAIPFTVVRPLCLPLFPKKYPVVQSFCVLARWNPFFLPLFPVLSTSAFRSFGSFFPFSFSFFLFLFLFFSARNKIYIPSTSYFNRLLRILRGFVSFVFFFFYIGRNKCGNTHGGITARSGHKYYRSAMSVKSRRIGIHTTKSTRFAKSV